MLQNPHQNPFCAVPKHDDVVLSDAGDAVLVCIAQQHHLMTPYDRGSLDRRKSGEISPPRFLTGRRRYLPVDLWTLQFES